MTENKTYTILLVEDDSFLVDMYSLKFTEAGYNIQAVFGAQEGIDKLEEGFKPDAIILDIVMPDMDGFAFLEALKEKRLAEGAAVIVLSNQGEKKDHERAKEFGVVGHIVKANAIPSEVVSIVTGLIDKHKNNPNAQKVVEETQQT